MASEQCLQCTHWVRRGGFVFAPEMTCDAFEDEARGNTLTLLIAMAVQMAKGGKCPTFDPLPPLGDGVYRSEDLLDLNKAFA